MMKLSLKTVTVLALLVAVHLANVTCPKGYHFKDDYDQNRNNRYMSSSTLNGYCRKNDYGCKDFNGNTGDCQKCDDGYDKKKNSVSGDYCEMSWGMIWTIVGSVAGVFLVICILCAICAACGKKSKKDKKSKKNKHKGSDDGYNSNQDYNNGYNSGQGYGQPQQPYGYQGGYQGGNQGGYQQGY